jgi:hypothetical protein
MSAPPAHISRRFDTNAVRTTAALRRLKSVGRLMARQDRIEWFDRRRAFRRASVPLSSRPVRVYSRVRRFALDLHPQAQPWPLDHGRAFARHPGAPGGGADRCQARDLRLTRVLQPVTKFKCQSRHGRTGKSVFGPGPKRGFLAFSCAAETKRGKRPFRNSGNSPGLNAGASCLHPFRAVGLGLSLGT